MFRLGVLFDVFPPLLNQSPPQVPGIIRKERNCTGQIALFEQGSGQIVRRMLADFFDECRVGLGVEVGEFLLLGSKFLLVGAVFLGLSGLANQRQLPRLLAAVEDAVERIVIVRRNAIVLVIVATVSYTHLRA